MIESTSSFIKSSIPLYHNAVKSIIFKCAELLMGIFIFKLFSLIAARSNQFTSYLMLTEDYIQRTLYITSRGLSRAGLVVLTFSLLNIVLGLYGTLLWALDSPGYIFRASNVTIADYQDQRNENPSYIIQLSLDSGQLQDVEKKIPQIIGADLFVPGLNYTLTGQVTNNDLPEIVAPARERGVGARIWLDSDGLSVSPDTGSMVPPNSALDGETFEPCWIFDNGSAAWNCTFNNVFSTSLIATVAGKPEIHWNNATDTVFDSRYMLPNREDNIWFSLGGGGGSALMNQVFTITKEKRRHTFSQSTFKATMVTTVGTPFAREEVTDLVQRTWSANETERKNPLAGRIVDSMMNAQDRKVSYQFGANTADNGNKSALQSNWGFYTAESNGTTMYSLISITTTNITLIRSETLSDAPKPIEKCERSNFQNEAFGGKITRTDCAGSRPARGKPEFFGQVDTAVVMVAYGLGNGRSNISAQSLNNDVLTWVRNNSETLESLLVARAYTVSIDPSLVQITVDKLTVAMSRLQVVLSCLALLLAIVLWLGLMIFADAHWASSLMANLINTTSEPRKTKPGYMLRTPDVALQSGGQKKKFLAVDGKMVTLYNPTSIPMQQPTGSPAPYMGDVKNYMETGACPAGYDGPIAAREDLLSGQKQSYADAR
ncbi:uncharacterized protein FOBCDRAFT_227550 [Fusarium oxysporum Fo47]|uniref:uncharacterized protein n=1 Tax=Fusarium oxysporum Fo47 TaxID=660027 RepID=UPI00159AD7E3|nr:uncharacterized protein FOBCDRAFT_227550 [Fusarium oxysporum Fo47]QKD57015.1 hypothetical protein FOBCDRAFT_227550 [Fusarium oxysporum Fo47]